WPSAACSLWDGLCQRSVCVQSDERTQLDATSSAWLTRREHREQLRGCKSVGLAGARAAWCWPPLRAVWLCGARLRHAHKPPGKTPPANAGPCYCGTAPEADSGYDHQRGARCPTGALGRSPATPTCGWLEYG